MADNQNSERTGQAHAYHALATVFAQGFRFLAWINGLGVLCSLGAAVGILGTNVSPGLFRIPLAAYIAGLALCGVGLLWSYLVQTLLFSQLVEGRHRRSHWVPLACTLLAYGLSLVMFVAGCWVMLHLAELASQNPAYSSQSYGSQDGDEVAPLNQSGNASQLVETAPVEIVLRVPARGDTTLPGVS